METWGLLTQQKTEEEESWGAVFSSGVGATLDILCETAGLSEEMIPVEVLIPL